MKWFRFYDDVVNDPKVQRLPDGLFRAWVNLMCLASKGGGVIEGKLADIAFSLRMTETKASLHIEALRAAGLFEYGSPLRPHNWSNRQYESDSSSNRVKAFRERQRNVSVTPPETPPDTEADTERTPSPIGLVPQISATEEQPHVKRAKPRRVFPDDWQPSVEDRQHATGLGLDPDDQARRCIGYSIANGKPYANHSQAYRNWCDRSVEFTGRAYGSGRGQIQRGPASTVEIGARLAARYAAAEQLAEQAERRGAGGDAMSDRREKPGISWNGPGSPDWDSDR